MEEPQAPIQPQAPITTETSKLPTPQEPIPATSLPSPGQPIVPIVAQAVTPSTAPTLSSQQPADNAVVVGEMPKIEQPSTDSPDVTTSHEVISYSSGIELPKQKSGIPMFIKVGVPVFLLVIIIAVAISASMIAGSSKQSSKNKTKANASSQAVTSKPKAAPAGYKQFVTPCYTVNVKEIYNAKIDEHGNNEPCALIAYNSDNRTKLTIGKIAIIKTSAEQRAKNDEKDFGSKCKLKSVKINDNVYSVESYCPNDPLTKYGKNYYFSNNLISIEAHGVTDSGANSLADDAFAQFSLGKAETSAKQSTTSTSKSTQVTKPTYKAFPESVRADWMVKCKALNNKNQDCACDINWIQQHYTLDEYNYLNAHPETMAAEDMELFPSEKGGCPL